MIRKLVYVLTIIITGIVSTIIATIMTIPRSFFGGFRATLRACDDVLNK